MASQGSSSSPMLVHRSNQNTASFFSWSHTHKGSSLYSSKRSLLPDHLLEAREVQQKSPFMFNVYSQYSGMQDRTLVPAIYLVADVRQLRCFCKLQKSWVHFNTSPTNKND